jgi:hypothetical protein
VPAFVLLRKPVVLVALGILAVAGVILGVALARSPTAGCTVPAPPINLPAQLRSLGELSQPFDLADPRSLADASVRAATSLHSDLAGASADGVVREFATDGAQHDGVVVPLSVAQGSTGQRRVVGLVAYLLDCTGRAYYDDTLDLLRSNPAALPAHFPVLTQSEAATQLGTAQPKLVYRDTPFAPFWQNPSTGATVSAGVE